MSDVFPSNFEAAYERASDDETVKDLERCQTGNHDLNRRLPLRWRFGFPGRDEVVEVGYIDSCACGKEQIETKYADSKTQKAAHPEG